MSPSRSAQSGFPDLGFIQRTYRMSALVGAAGALALGAAADWQIPAGWIVGVTLGLTTLRSKEALARALMASGQRQSCAWFLVLTLANYMVTALVLGLVLRYRLVNLIWMLAGFTLVLLVIVLKAIGWHCFVRAPRHSAPPSRRSAGQVSA